MMTMVMMMMVMMIVMMMRMMMMMLMQRMRMWRMTMMMTMMLTMTVLMMMTATTKKLCYAKDFHAYLIINQNVPPRRTCDNRVAPIVLRVAWVMAHKDCPCCI